MLFHHDCPIERGQKPSNYCPSLAGSRFCRDIKLIREVCDSSCCKANREICGNLLTLIVDGVHTAHFVKDKFEWVLKARWSTAEEHKVIDSKLDRMCDISRYWEDTWRVFKETSTGTVTEKRMAEGRLFGMQGTYNTLNFPKRFDPHMPSARIPYVANAPTLYTFAFCVQCWLESFITVAEIEYPGIIDSITVRNSEGKDNPENGEDTSEASIKGGKRPTAGSCAPGQKHSSRSDQPIDGEHNAKMDYQHPDYQALVVRELRPRPAAQGSKSESQPDVQTNHDGNTASSNAEPRLNSRDKIFFKHVDPQEIFDFGYSPYSTVSVQENTYYHAPIKVYKPQKPKYNNFEHKPAPRQDDHNSHRPDQSKRTEQRSKDRHSSKSREDSSSKKFRNFDNSDDYYNDGRERGRRDRIPPPRSRYQDPHSDLRGQDHDIKATQFTQSRRRDDPVSRDDSDEQNRRPRQRASESNSDRHADSRSRRNKSPTRQTRQQRSANINPQEDTGRDTLPTPYAYGLTEGLRSPGWNLSPESRNMDMDPSKMPSDTSMRLWIADEEFKIMQERAARSRARAYKHTSRR